MPPRSPRKTMQVNIHDPDSVRYLIVCARIRDITVTKLVRQLIEVIARDQFVIAHIFAIPR